MATSGGVTKFDGDNFKNFSTNDGLTDYEVISLFEDSSSRIWFATFNGLPCYYKDEKIFNYSNDPLLRDVELTEYIKTMFEDDDKNIWLGSKNRTIKINYKENRVDTYELPSYILHENKSNEVISHYYFDTQTNINEDVKLIQKTPLGASTIHNPITGISASKVLNTGGVLYAVQSKLYLKSIDVDSIYEIKQLSPFDQSTSIRNIDQDKDGTLYIATTEGAFICDLDDENMTLSISETYFKGKNTTCFTLDHQKGLWISSQDGVYHFKNDGLKILNPEIGTVNLLNRNDKRIVISESNNKISIIDLNDFTILKTFITDTEPKTIENVIGELYVITDYQIYKIVDDAFYEIHFNHSAKDIENINGTYLLATHSGVFTVDSKLIDSRSIKLNRLTENKHVSRLFEKRVFKIFRIGQLIYISTIEGVKVYDNSLRMLDSGISTSNFRPNDITTYDDKVVISTYQDGIYVYQNHQIIDTINATDGLLSNQVIKAMQYHDRLIVVTGQGIQYLDKDLEPHQIFGLTNLDTKINGAEINGDLLILATAKGLLYFDLKTKIERKTSPKSDISVYHNEKLISHFDTLTYNSNSVEIHFQVFDYAEVEENIVYRLYPENEEWNEFDTDRIRYQGLKPDTYVFQIKDEKEIINEFTFHIKTPIWHMLWFRILAAGLVLGLIYSYFKFRVKRIIKKKEKKYAFELKLANAEQKALKAQMNPHFIFNALNAIQNLIINEKTYKAYKYLGDFSKLVRRVLLHSRKTETNVKSEIEFLTLYLELEKLRFEDQFHFSFDQESNFNLDHIIPSMVLQPFVENAIIHGLVPQTTQKVPQIKINFREDPSYIYCLISDNGIGFDLAAQEPKNKESLGLKIISERLEIYDPTGQSNYKIESSPEGTQITLQLIKRDESSNNRR